MWGERADELRRVAEQVVGEAAAFVRSRRTQLFGPVGHPPAAVRAKSSPTDPVTLADTETERLVRDRLAQLRPGESILGEEQGAEQSAEQDQASGTPGAVRWVVDPIDGTVNFIYGIPAYAVSLAAQVDGVSVAGAVADVCTCQVYSAAAGGGAWVTAGDEPTALRCTGVTDLSMALVGTGFGYERRRRAAQAALLAKLLPEVRDIRRIGSAALDLCAVAAGRLDAHYEHGLNLWDWAAGALIAAEAGAEVVLPDRPAGLLVAAAPGVAGDLIEALRRHAPPMT
jgi:myo-inositol-1(or 4)-monophosphatase